MRELIRYFREAARFAQLRNLLKIDLPIAQDVVNRQQQAIALRLNLDHRESLRTCLCRRDVPGLIFPARAGHLFLPSPTMRGASLMGK